MRLKGSGQTTGQRLVPASKGRFLRARLGNGSFRPHFHVAHPKLGVYNGGDR